jgi:hypothetical protein
MRTSRVLVKGCAGSNKRVQSDAVAAAGSGARLGYVTRLDLKPISVNSRRG